MRLPSLQPTRYTNLGVVTNGVPTQLPTRDEFVPNEPTQAPPGRWSDKRTGLYPAGTPVYRQKANDGDWQVHPADGRSGLIPPGIEYGIVGDGGWVWVLVDGGPVASGPPAGIWRGLPPADSPIPGLPPSPPWGPRERFEHFWTHRGKQLVGREAGMALGQRIQRRRNAPAHFNLDIPWQGPLQPGDEVWTFNTQTAPLSGEWGIMVVRPKEGKLVATFIDAVS